MTNEKISALAAVRAAIIAAETTGLTEAEICKAAVNGLVPAEVKSGRPPGNYNPIADGPDKQKGKAQHG
jgi:methyl coenzyme M reductase beta subunit